ncbi:SusC/RagA family TonB-linked outer membrane protein [Arcticibacter eurypsychrophilus]|uniref:SusC/RagA family TonB-linked outer membrane protein n=1 Tax=Arcticibacter eurypsychrophilus TaxID=1434752 RepID=UPI0009F46185|nr:SusC/RagA family TonB-linked outer membrane protein [Arcticibacter eurypsychrophilus]
MKKILLLLCILGVCLNVLAQTVTFKGKVVSAVSGVAVPSATITIKGTTNRVLSDQNGLFSILGLPTSVILTISSIGYVSRDIRAVEGRLMNIVLNEDNRQLGEVIVVGYSNKKKSELTSAVAVVSADDLKDVTANTIGTMLQGKVAGLQVVNSSGAPGAAAEIRLRGVSSINASQSPLVVVDGIIGGNYDPNDVESVTVLKDAGATAMYGSQANAGVIIVTTKTAKAGKTQFEARLVSGIRTADFGKMKMMNGSELYEHQKEFYHDYIPGATDNSYKIDLIKFYSERPLELRDQNYNWGKKSFTSEPMYNFYLSAAGKTDKADYYAGLSYYKEKGTFMNTDYQRVNLRANSTYRFSDKISVSNNINLSGNTGKSYDYMDVYYSFLNMPWDNPYDESGNPIYVDGNSTFKWWSRDKINPVHTVANSDHPYKGFDLNYDFTLNYTLTKWLTFTSSSRVAASFNKGTNYFSRTVAGTYHNNGYLDELNTLNYGGISNNLFKFNFQFGDHALNGLAGLAFEGSKSEYSGGSGKGLPEGLRVLNVVSNSQLVNGYNNRSALQSFISQLNYSFKNRYFLTGSYRIDESSAFPEANRRASFPAASAAWLISNEDFLKQSPVLSNLKLRLSYGITGTQDIGASRYLGLFALNTQYNALSGAIPYQLASPNLTWESKHQTNGGIDIGLFKRVDLSIDAYHNVTKDLLLQVSQPLSVGFEQRWENSGTVVNDGIEFSLNTANIKTRDFDWNTNFTVNFNSNKLKDFPSDIIKTGASWSISQIYRDGGNLYEFYMPEWLGVDAETGAPTWAVVIKDENGKAVSKEATTDYEKATMQEVGSALAKYQGGFNNSFRYKNIGLQVNTYFNYGNKVFSNNLRFVMNDGHEPYYNQLKMPDDAVVWTKPGDIATEPSPQNSANSTETSTRYLKDGGFFTIRNIALSFDFPKPWINKLNLQGLTFSLSADNVATFSNFLGQDPQTTIVLGSYTTPGVSDFKYPNNRQFLFNINCRF